ncbi:hypothetical protein BJ508DRAFT_331307 [Ascobolus immersus RN42]|uniref:Uncharacterized protein n=1 Tax=Ascobolus immersus RN42 TaxID=1160509 RepID=A0A3N4HQX2_ASCIM|nr:hypothetical protein BJ508DRAFT_331307 [Ascobolus immersus RN42]
MDPFTSRLQALWTPPERLSRISWICNIFKYIASRHAAGKGLEAAHDALSGFTLYGDEHEDDFGYKLVLFADKLLPEDEGCNSLVFEFAREVSNGLSRAYSDKGLCLDAEAISALDLGVVYLEDLRVDGAYLGSCEDAEEDRYTMSGDDQELEDKWQITKRCIDLQIERDSKGPLLEEERHDCFEDPRIWKEQVAKHLEGKEMAMEPVMVNLQRLLKKNRSQSFISQLKKKPSVTGFYQIAAVLLDDRTVKFWDTDAMINDITRYEDNDCYQYLGIDFDKYWDRYPRFISRQKRIRSRSHPTFATSTAYNFWIMPGYETIGKYEVLELPNKFFPCWTERWEVVGKGEEARRIDREGAKHCEDASFPKERVHLGLLCIREALLLLEELREIQLKAAESIRECILNDRRKDAAVFLRKFMFENEERRDILKRIAFFDLIAIRLFEGRAPSVDERIYRYLYEVA